MQQKKRWTGSWQALVPALSLKCSVSLGKSLTFSKPQLHWL